MADLTPEEHRMIARKQREYGLEWCAQVHEREAAKLETLTDCQVCGHDADPETRLCPRCQRRADQATERGIHDGLSGRG